MSSGPFPRPAEPLADELVALRQWGEEDVPALVDILQDPAIVRWTRIPCPYTEAHARAFITGPAVPETSFAIIDAGDGRLIGAIGLRPAGPRGGQVGYWVAAAERGRGVATRALRLLTRWAFDDLGLERVEVLVQPENAASRRVPEKAGFRRERYLPRHLDVNGGRRDAVMFSLCATDVGSRP